MDGWPDCVAVLPLCYRGAVQAVAQLCPFFSGYSGSGMHTGGAVCMARLCVEGTAYMYCTTVQLRGQHAVEIRSNNDSTFQSARMTNRYAHGARAGRLLQSAAYLAEAQRSVLLSRHLDCKICTCV
eukprot:jgi/Ulvmu1/649/UM010_0020.1